MRFRQVDGCACFHYTIANCGPFPLPVVAASLAEISFESKPPAIYVVVDVKGVSGLCPILMLNFNMSPKSSATL